MIVTIDGPTASGKSATAQRLAQKLGAFYLNSGFLYRAMAYLLMRDRSYTPETVGNVTESDINTFLDPQRLIYSCDDKGNPRLEFDGVDITPYLKGGSGIDRAASIVSANKFVRAALLDVQRDIGLKHDLITDGRDTGTIVFPHADFKFYLTAPLEIRVARWMRDQEARGTAINFEQACKELAMRDERDMTRTIAPLVVPQGAIIIDNGLYSLDETVDMLYKKIHN